MGYDASCRLSVDGKTSRGNAWLEHKALVFRGESRLAIPLASISSAVARGGTLRVTFGARTADFHIGKPAEKWAGRITNPPSRLDKLGVKPGISVAVLGNIGENEQDCADFVAELEQRGARVARRIEASWRADLVFLAAANRAALGRLAALAEAIVPAGAVWVVRPKGQKAITESDTMEAGKRAGFVDVKVASFSETHTAEKFVIPVARRPPTGQARTRRAGVRKANAGRSPR